MQKSLTVFYLLDTSGSMNEDNKIQQLNEGMRESMQVLTVVSKDPKQPRIKVAVLTFDDVVTWQSSLPVELRNYSYVPLAAEGCTVFDGACAELSSKLDWIRDDNGFYNPVIIAMSDGCPTDGKNNGFGQGLKTLKNNKIYKNAIKIAIAIGSKKGDFTFANLADFTGTEEAVIPVDNINRLKKVIKLVSYKSVSIGSELQKNGNTPEETQKLINKVLEEEFQDYDDDFDDEGN